MEKVFRWIVALGSILLVLWLSLYIYPKFACLVLSVLLLLSLIALLPVALIDGISKWRKSSKFWPMPALVCVAFIVCTFYGVSPIASRISDKLFAWHRGDYVRIVNDFRDGRVLCASSCNEALKVIEVTNLPAHVRDIFGAHCDGGSVVVLFRHDTNVPLLHEGYMFKDYGEASVCSKRFGSREHDWSDLPYVRQIEGHWYRFSDQPGF